MAVQAWQDVSLLFGATEIATQAKTFQLDASAEVLDTTALSTTGWSESIGGKKTVTLTFGLMADFTATVTEGAGSVYPQKVRSDYIVTASAQALEARSIVLGSADGSTAYLGDSLTTSFTPVEGEPGGLAMAQLAAVYSGKVARGVLLHPGSASRTSSGTGTGRQLGAVSATQKMYAALHVLHAAGASADQSLTVIVQSDDNSGFTSPTTRISFTAATTVSEQFSSVDGAVTDDYWRVSYTVSGTSPTFKFAVTAGIA